MTTSVSDFDAAKAVADQLKGMEKDRQQKILRWVAESLNLDLLAPVMDRRTTETHVPTGDAKPPRGDLQTHQQQQRSTDIKSFVELKRPKSAVQFAAVVAYFYRFEASTESRKDSVDAQVLKEAARLAGGRWRKLKALPTLGNTKTLGYLDSPERGQFRINSVGENLVAMTLPGNEPERARKKPGLAKKLRKTKRR